MPRRWTLVLLVVLAPLACREPERLVDVRWELPAGDGPCGAPGREALVGETWVRLRYAHAPRHFEDFCSRKLATALAARANRLEPALVVGTPESYAICAVAGLSGKRLSKGCAFENHVRNGREGPADGPRPF